MRPAVPTPDPAPARRPIPAILVLVCALLVAVLLGLMGRATNDGAFRGAWEFSRLGGPWLVAAFAAGALGGWRRRTGGLLLGTVSGAVAIALGSLAYYGISVAFEGNTEVHRAAVLGIGWGLAGLAVGGVLGLLGALWATALGTHARRDGRREGSWLQGVALGTLGGLLMGESIALLWVWDQPGLRAMATLEGLAGAALVAVGGAVRSWRFILGSLVAVAITATVAPIATTLLRDALRTVGWAGA